MSDKDNVVAGLLKGISVSEGIAIGKVWILESPWDEVEEIQIAKNKINHEIERYQIAFREVVQQLVDCRDRVEREIGEEEANIFTSHLAILNDSFFREEIPSLIENKGKNGEYLLKQGIDQLNDSFSKIKSEYFRHRIDDVRDVAGRLLRVLLQSEEAKFSQKSCLSWLPTASHLRTRHESIEKKYSDSLLNWEGKRPMPQYWHDQWDCRLWWESKG